ncbi:MAG: histidine--tRNA ligase [Candidatus Omnitrophica bacterium]|nr:histidine--tRNA ligase [Candidatus Omnitrophota bacterium]
MYKRIAGTKDILPDEVVLWQQIEQTIRQVFSLYNYKEIRPPVIEDAALFNRSLGESAEIVQKQMFLIHNKEDTYALRPEGTASVVRSYIENNLDKTNGFLKLYYVGPMFRFERPQKGRLRQFHHIGCEVIGSLDPDLDVEVISLANTLLTRFGISGYKIKINSLGCQKDKAKFNTNLQSALKDKINALCEDCQVRYQKNPLRILDCKNEECQKIVRGLDIYETYLCPECKDHFAKVREGLDVLKVNYEVVPYLVRGLDYYTGTVFEISHPDLGAQDALGAGGRYNNLVKELGGPDLGAIGFAFGVERLLLCMQNAAVKTQKSNLVYIISLGQTARKETIKLLDLLRKNDIIADIDYENKSLKAAMRKANDLGAKFVLIVGDDELKKGVVMLKDMQKGEQKEVNFSDLLKELKC